MCIRDRPDPVLHQLRRLAEAARAGKAGLRLLADYLSRGSAGKVPVLERADQGEQFPGPGGVEMCIRDRFISSGQGLQRS